MAMATVKRMFDLGSVAQQVALHHGARTASNHPAAQLHGQIKDEAAATRVDTTTLPHHLHREAVHLRGSSRVVVDLPHGRQTETWVDMVEVVHRLGNSSKIHSTIFHHLRLRQRTFHLLRHRLPREAARGKDLRSGQVLLRNRL